MGGLFGGSKVKAAAVAPAPQVKINAQDAQAKKRGQKATILTSDTGLPNLGVTTTTGQ